MPDSLSFLLRSRIALGVASVAVGFALWIIVLAVADIPSYILPHPRDVGAALWEGLWANPANRGSYWFHFSPTLQAAFAGFAISAIAGVAIAAAMAEFKAVEYWLFPYIVGLQSLPKVAVAPLFIIWFGYQIESKIAIAATISVFPILMNSFQGFTSVERDRLDLMASLRAGRFQTFWRIKLPSALPFIFAGLNLGIVYALLGTLVAEFMGGQKGVGVMISQLQAVSG
ncbi:ABC transporter permease [Xenophilus azovorans]|uniref:ABC transporter permease n=1 Tax=Xenophilus azovorans TaxID=151755 RepID=UPI00068A31EB|nr:ABC transporter permease [Xenophilus azovorans]